VAWTESYYSEETAFRLARGGALVRIVTAEDACAVCTARAQSTYTPSEVPRLPIRGCTRERCRCRFVAVDPETELTVPELVQRGIYALRAGRREQAQQILRHAVTLDERYEPGWLWLSGVVDDSEKIICLRHVLQINPNNQRAREGLAALLQKVGAQKPSPAQQPEPAQPSEAPSAEVLPEEPSPAQQPEPAQPSDTLSTDLEPEEPAAEEEPVPVAVLEIREEREVILEQWADFARIASQTDPQMLSVQGGAFLKKIQMLNEQALAATSPMARLEELQQQWNESHALGEALVSLLDAHDRQRSDTQDWQVMRRAIRQLAQKLLQLRTGLRIQITDEGGVAPTE
jgi:hypothetical protein